MKAEVITYFRYFVDRSFEQFSDRRSVNERASQDAEYIEHAPVKTAVMFGDSNKAVRGYGTIICILTVGLELTGLVPFDGDGHWYLC